MDAAGLHHRPAAQGDRAALASFLCTSTDPRLESWVRNDSLDRHLYAHYERDCRLLLFQQDDGALVAVTAHERNFLVGGPDGEPLPGSYFLVVAIGDRFRDGRAPDGRPLIAAVLSATFADICSRDRGSLVVMMVRRGNPDGLGVVKRLGATYVGMSEDDEVYTILLEALPPTC